MSKRKLSELYVTEITVESMDIPKKLFKIKDRECVLHCNFDECMLYNCSGVKRDRLYKEKKQEKTNNFDLYS